MGALGAPITAQPVTRLAFLPSIREATHAQSMAWAWFLTCRGGCIRKAEDATIIGTDWTSICTNRSYRTHASRRYRK
jgi:hypothetical protein